ncbi:MAG: SDR family oxidoreductase [Betaproteobacteria bacterium]
MPIKLRPLQQQVVVLTDASSSVGLVTARLAAQRGARVVLGGRDGEALQQLATKIEAAGGHVAYLTADAGNPADMEHLAETAISRFGRIDTWVNNASAALYGRIEDTPLEAMRQLFDTDFWGVVNGSRAAIPRLKASGGALINVGSVVGDRAIPLQGIGSASKHAVKGFTDALRMELGKARAPVSVTLIKPAAIDTPLVEHTGAFLPGEVQLPSATLAPETVAEAILRAGITPVRDVYCGGGARVMAMGGFLVPRIMDRYMQRTLFGQRQERQRRQARRDSNRYGPRDERGPRPGGVGQVIPPGFHIKAVAANPSAALAALGLIALGAMLWRRREPTKRMARRQG